MPQTTQLTELYDPVAQALADARDAVADIWRATFHCANAEVERGANPGGKYLRPALALLSAGALGAPNVASFVPLASAMEIMHLAALAHDDVIDDADLRRGARSLKSLWSNHAAVLAGDYLVARAVEFVGRYDSCALLMEIIDALRKMTEGELMLLGRDGRRCNEDDCLRVAECKTASLFMAACASPALLLPGAPTETLRRYGLSVGMAFQLADDLLDLTQDEEILGKPACGDVGEGKPTLPLLFMREAFSASERARLDGLRGATLTAKDRAWVAQSVVTTGARDRVEALAGQYIDDAQRAVASLDPSPYRDSLMGLAEFVLNRNS